MEIALSLDRPTNMKILRKPLTRKSVKQHYLAKTLVVSHLRF